MVGFTPIFRRFEGKRQPGTFFKRQDLFAKRQAGTPIQHLAASAAPGPIGSKPNPKSAAKANRESPMGARDGLGPLLVLGFEPRDTGSLSLPGLRPKE